MSYAWSFQSFSAEAFGQVFGRTPPERVEKFLETVASDLGAASAEFARAARSILTSCVTYEGASPGEARAIDEVIRLAFSTEGFAADLEVEDLSPDGVHPSVIAELVGRLGAPAPLLSGLLRGRRFGEDALADCEYCIFRADEVSVVLQEILDASATNSPWSADYLPELIEECLVEPFAAAERAGRPVFCHLS